MCIRMILALLLCTATFAGCAGYTTLEWPRKVGELGNEFGASTDLRAGQRVRVATTDQVVIEGALVEVDSVTVTVAPEGSARGVVSVAVVDISKLEVFTPTSWRPIRTAALVVAGSLATYAVIDELTNRNPEATDWEPAKRR